MRWGFVSPHVLGTKARADQRAGRDLVHLTDVPGCLSPSSLPCRRRRLLRMEKDRTDAGGTPSSFPSTLGKVTQPVHVVVTGGSAKRSAWAVNRGNLSQASDPLDRIGCC